MRRLHLDVLGIIVVFVGIGSEQRAIRAKLARLRANLHARPYPVARKQSAVVGVFVHAIVVVIISILKVPR